MMHIFRMYDNPVVFVSQAEIETLGVSIRKSAGNSGAH